MAHRLLEIQEGGQKFIDRVSSPRVFRAYMMVKAPVLGISGASLQSLDTSGARMLVPFGRRIKNLFGKMFGGAVLAAAETTSASMIVLHMRNQGVKLTADLLHVDYKMQANPETDIRVMAHDGLSYAKLVKDAAESGEPTEATFNVAVVDENDQQTHEIELTWRVQINRG